MVNRKRPKMTNHSSQAALNFPKSVNTFSWKVTIISAVALVILVLALQGNQILGQALKDSSMPSTGTEPQPKTLPPCPADTWPHIFDGNSAAGAVGNSKDLAYALTVTNDGSYLYVGGNQKQLGVVPNYEKLWVSKHDHCGNVLWITHLEGTIPGDAAT